MPSARPAQIDVRVVRHPLRPRVLEVRRARWLTPRMRRVTLTGPDLEAFTCPGPADHIKLILPADPDGRPAMPTIDERGRPVPPPGPRPVVRDYTTRRFELLPAGARATVLVEVDGPEEEQELPTRADARVVWLHRDGAEPGAIDLLAGALRDVDLDGDDPYVWMAGEARSLRPARRHLRDDLGLDPSRYELDGYWKRGVVNLDHHAADDESD